MSFKVQLYSDESAYIGKSRYRTICVISGKEYDINLLNKELSKILRKYEVKELKFSKINTHISKIKSAKEFIDISLKYVNEKKIKIYTLTWDAQDSRHTIKNRDDIENLKRMYYKIVKIVNDHWIEEYGSDIVFEFYPDEHSAIDWEKDVSSFIKNTNFTKNHRNTLWGMGNPIFVNLEQTEERQSEISALIQLADLYAGMVRQSFDAINDDIPFGSKLLFHKSKKENRIRSQRFLFKVETTEIDLSKREEAKYDIILYFKKLADEYKLGVNLSESKYLKTF